MAMLDAEEEGRDCACQYRGPSGENGPGVGWCE